MNVNLSIWTSEEELKWAMELIESLSPKERKYKKQKDFLTKRQWNSAMSYYNKKKRKKFDLIPERYEIKKSYQKYLSSDRWQELRQECLEKFDHKCATCNQNYQLHVHHRTYENKDTENEINDLVVLCSKCHTLIHENRKIDGKIRIKKKKKVKISDEAILEIFSMHTDALKQIFKRLEDLENESTGI